jgi:hypothetical protein
MALKPEFSISSGAAARVFIIDTTSHIANIPIFVFMTPPMDGYETVHCPSYAFLVENSSGRKVVSGLGIRKDTENLTPAIRNKIQIAKVVVEKGVDEILRDHKVQPEEIEAIIWR